MGRAVGVIECAGRREVANVSDLAAWRAFCVQLRELLSEQMNRGGACVSAVVSVHFADERCDHETGA